MKDMTGRPLLSIIVPCYNMSQYVRRTIDSLIANDYPAKQLILVDDGSTDGTLAILHEYAARHRFIEVVTKPNGGVSSARNAGLDHARGEYVTFVDSDDEVASDYMAVIAEAIEGYDILHFAYSDAQGKPHYSISMQYDTHEEVIERLFPSVIGYGQANVNNWLRGGELKGTINGHVWAYAFRKSIIDAYHLRFAPHIIAGEDQMFVCTYLLHANSFLSIPDALYKYMIRGDGAFMENIKATDIDKTLQTKIDLLEERQHISSLWRDMTGRSHDDARALYVGSAVLSCFQLAWLFSRRRFKGYHPFATYARLPEARRCAGKIMPDKRSGMRKWLPAVLLKKRRYFLLYTLFVLARMLHIKMSY